jgi:hypothetical protein
MLMLVAGLLGCGDGDGGDVLGETPTLSGQIDGWSAGAGYTVNAMLFALPSFPTIGTAAIDESGAFSLQLSGSDVVTPYLFAAGPGPDTICSSNPILALPPQLVSPPELKSVLLLLTAKKAGSKDIPIVLANRTMVDGLMAGEIIANHMYADQDGSIVGQSQCAPGGSSAVADWNLELHKGWNLIVTRYSEYSEGPTGFRSVSQVSGGPLPAEVKWESGK